MNKLHTWESLERICTPDISPEEKSLLEEQFQKDPELRQNLFTYRILQSWAVQEREINPPIDSTAVFERLENEWKLEAVDRELGRLFPFIASAALAAAILLGTLNLISMKDSTNDPLDALFGLPQHSLDDMILAEL